MNKRLRYAYKGFLVERCDSSTPIWSQNNIIIIHKIRQLALQHERQCVNDCNGYGFVPRKGFFYNGKIDDYAKREYGPFVKSAYLTIETDGIVETLEETVFNQEIERIEKKIRSLLETLPVIQCRFQHDPRGATVHLFIKYSAKDKRTLTDILYL